MIHQAARLAHAEITLRTASSANKASSITPLPVTRQNPRAFAQELSKLGNAGNVAAAKIPETSSQTIAAGQVSVATAAHREVATGFAALIPPTTAASTAVAAAAPAEVMGNSKTGAVKHWYANDPVDDAYWAKQPAAVQQLREIDDRDQRMALGTQLAHQGYNIDVPIMMWGWDAGKVTAMRQSNGYTWVPSALQDPVTAAPGLTGPGIIPYDPLHPPVGSILV
jgi:hypothetical protein